MFGSELDFIDGLLTDSSVETTVAIIKDFDLPVLLERTLTETYVKGLEIKEIAHLHNVDDRTVKRWKKEALKSAVYRTKEKLRILSLQ